MSRLVLFLLLLTSTMFSQVGIGTTVPDASAALDITSNNAGILIPRISITSINDMVTVSSPATGLLIYNTTAAGVVPNDVKPGFYYWNGSRWIPFSSENIYTHNGSLVSDRQVSLAGNSLTFTGSSNDYIIMNDSGSLGINANPATKMHINVGAETYSGMFLEQDNFTSEVYMYEDYTNGFQENRLFLENNDATGTISFGFDQIRHYDMSVARLSPAGDNLYSLGGPTNRWLELDATTIYTTNPVVVSDKRLKKEIEINEYGLGVLEKINTYTYKYVSDELDQQHIGVMAQEMESILPQLVRTRGETGNLGVNYVELIPVLIKAIQEQQQQIVYLQNQINQ